MGAEGNMPFEKLVVIDARGHLMGRLASFVAKEALNGQKVVVVRCAELVISGSFIRNKLKLLMKRVKRMNTNPKKGPFPPRSPADMFLRVMRGMLPHKQYRGSAAFQRIKCVEGIPEPFNSIKRVLLPGQAGVRPRLGLLRCCGQLRDQAQGEECRVVRQGQGQEDCLRQGQGGHCLSDAQGGSLDNLSSLSRGK